MLIKNVTMLGLRCMLNKTVTLLEIKVITKLPNCLIEGKSKLIII